MISILFLFLYISVFCIFSSESCLKKWSRSYFSFHIFALSSLFWYIFIWKSLNKLSWSYFSFHIFASNFLLRNSVSSFHWLSSSIFNVRRRSSRIRDTSSHLHYMMFQTIQIKYFLWGYDPGNMSVSVSNLTPLNLSFAQLYVV